jgi:hypothetical protein
VPEEAKRYTVPAASISGVAAALLESAKKEPSSVCAEMGPEKADTELCRASPPSRGHPEPAAPPADAHEQVNADVALTAAEMVPAAHGVGAVEPAGQ